MSPQRMVVIAVLVIGGWGASTSPAIALDLEAAQHRVAPAGAWPPPMVELGVVNVPSGGRFDSDPMTMKMIGISQRLPRFGGRGLSSRAAMEGVNAESAALYQTEQEYLIELSALTAAPGGKGHEGGAISAARTRLAQFGVSPEEIRRLVVERPAIHHRRPLERMGARRPLRDGLHAGARRRPGHVHHRGAPGPRSGGPHRVHLPHPFD